MFTELLKLPLSELLGLSVLGAIVTTIGSFIALLLKEYFFVRSFEKWKIQQNLEQLFRKYRDPILLATQELSRRLEQISADYPPLYLQSRLLAQQPQHIENNSDDDPYYQVYKLKSSIYRLCAFLGWLELYRQEIVFLHSGQNHANQKLQNCLDAIQSDLADGQLNQSADWMKWKDRLIFREEQRAIGEAMIVELSGKNSVMGYGKFCNLLNSEHENQQHVWLQQVISFLTDLEAGGKDFRQIRIQRLVVHLYDLVELLQTEPLPSDIKAKRTQYRKAVNL